MSIDLTKLSTAPWEAIAVDSEHGSYDIEDQRHVEVANVQGKADAKFIALARNAFDVMMRRGWVAVHEHLWGDEARCGLTGFVVREQGDTGRGTTSWKREIGKIIGPLGKDLIWAADPLTALVEADKWMTEREKAEAKEARA